VTYFTKRLNVAVFVLLISGCETVKIERVNCNLSQNWPQCNVMYRPTELLKMLNSKLTDAAVLLLLHHYSQNGLEESPLTKRERSAMSKLLKSYRSRL